MWAHESLSRSAVTRHASRETLAEAESRTHDSTRSASIFTPRLTHRSRPAPRNQRAMSSAPLEASSSSSTSATTAAAAAGPAIDDALARDYPQVARLPKDELQRLLEDEAYFDAYFGTSLAQATAYHQAVQQKMQQNLQLAQQSEALKPQLDALREDTARSFHEAKDLQQQWSLLDQAQQEAYRRFSQPAQLARYRAATTTQEHLSDALVDAFLNGDGDDESFVKQYREIRKVFHKREIGLQKWDEGKVVWM